MTLHLPYVMRKTCSLFCQRYDSCSAIYVRGKMCSLFCIKYDCCYALCVRGKIWSVLFVRWWKRCLLRFVYLSDVRCSFPMQRKWEHWFVGDGWVLVGLGTCAPGHLSSWVLVGLCTFCNELCMWMLSAILLGGRIVQKHSKGTQFSFIVFHLSLILVQNDLPILFHHYITKQV